MTDDTSDLWVFAYGSLMWRPGFPYCEAHHASLAGYHRAFCIYSIHYRGSLARPGLVLGLDSGGACEGLAFRVAADAAADTLAYLRHRELIYDVYREVRVPVTLHVAGHPLVRAVTYVAERAHQAYARALSEAEQAHLIRGALGSAGANVDYLANTLAHLAELGIRERALERLRARIGAVAVREGRDGASRPSAIALAKAWSRRAAAAPRMARDQRSRFRYRRSLAR